MLLQPDSFLQNGRYRILRRIGQGGMGAVYEAMDTRLNHRVAVKQALVSDPMLIQGFEREAQRLARLYHPALPNVTDHFSENGGQFLVMRFIDGADLAEQLERRATPFRSEQVLMWADRLLDALTYLHSQNPPLIHRDIKPANLKLTNQGEIILLDFGLAKGGLPNPTAAGTMPGYTLGYASYEQMVGETTNTRSDLYGLAATLYTLLTNHVPPNAIVRMSEQFNGGRDPLLPANEINPQVPIYVTDVLTHALALHSEKRPASAPVMRAMLKGPPPVLDNVPATRVMPDVTPATLPQHPPAVDQNLSAPTRINRNLRPSSVEREERGTATLPQDTPPPPPKTLPRRHDEKPDEDGSDLSLGILVLLLALFLLLILGVGTYFLTSRMATAEEPVIALPATSTLVPFTSTPLPEGVDEPVVEITPTVIQEVIIPEEASPTATEEVIIPEEATATPTEDPTPIPTPSLVRLGNGPDLRATRRTFDVTLDGIINEWGSATSTTIGGAIFQPENWSGREDLSGEVYATWDQQFLYLAVRVTDDTLVQESQDRLLHRGDAVEIFLDLDLAGDFSQDSYSEDDVQLVMSAGDIDTTPSSWVHYSPTGDFRDEIVLGGLESLDGYELEARIPWSRLLITPQSGQLYGYAVALSDDDSFGDGNQETQLSTSTELPFNHPINWGNLYLDP